MEIINRIIKDPILYLIFVYGRLLPDDIEHDKKYLELLYKHSLGKKLNLDPPITFNEKMQWLKLYNRNPKYTKMVDKYEAKKYVARIIGEQYIIPTLGVWSCFDEIDFNLLPEQFVLKCTHDSGGLVVCKDKSKLEQKTVKRKIEHCLDRNYFYNTREWPYKNVRPRIIAEKYMEDELHELTDYKFFCFNGEPKLMYVATDRNSPTEETKFDFYDMDFQRLPFTNGHPNSHHGVDKPRTFAEMKDLSAKLAKDEPFIRVDFYDVDGKLYFGELTLFHWSGIVKFEPDEWDKKLGDLICLN